MPIILFHLCRMRKVATDFYCSEGGNKALQQVEDKVLSLGLLVSDDAICNKILAKLVL